MFQTVDDDNLALVHEFSLGDYHGDGGIPGAYPLGMNGCGDGVPSEYCEGYQFQPGGMGALDSVDWNMFAVMSFGAVLGYHLGGKKRLSMAAFGAAGGALVMGLVRK